MKVSVVVPVYNVEGYIRKCLESILSQTFSDFEIIIVDDGATDNSASFCDEFLLIDSRIKVVHKKNGGLSSARLTGKKAAAGKYLLFIDSDDYIEPDMIEKMYSAITDNGSDAAICNYYVTRNGVDESVSLRIENETEKIFDKYVLSAIGGIPQKYNLPGFVPLRMYKSELLDDDMFVSEREYYTEDIILNMLYFDKVSSVAAVKEPLYHYVQRQTSLTYVYRENMWQMIQNRYSYIKKFLLSKNISDDNMQRLYFGGKEGLLDTVDNIVKGKAFNEAKKCFAEIVDSELFEEVKDNINMSYFSKSELLWFNMLKFKLFFSLYYYRKWRIKVSK